MLAAEGVEVKRVTPRSPNLNAVAERFVQTIQVECLDHFLVFGEAHLRHLISCYLSYYHTRRPHQSRDNWLLTGGPPPGPSALDPGDVVCEASLGGLLKHFRRAS